MTFAHAQRVPPRTASAPAGLFDCAVEPHAEESSMKTLSKAVWFGLVVGFIIQASSAVRAANASTSQPLLFKFVLNHPLVFSAISSTKTITDRTMQTDTGNKSALSKNTVETRYKLRLTPVRQSKEGVWTLHYEPFDFEEDMDSTANGSQISAFIRGLDVRSTQNGITVVDTAKGIGVNQGKSYKQGAYPKMLSGYFEFQPAGMISKVEGDLPFIDYWTDTIRYQVGFFDVVFPAGPVAPGGSWSTNLVVKDLEGIKLGDGGIGETNVFVREDDAPASTNHLISIDVSMAANPKSVLGSMDALGQNTMLNISEFNHNKSGKFLFDPAAGCLTKGDEQESVKMTMSMLVQGHTMTVTTELQINSKFELLKN